MKAILYNKKTTEETFIDIPESMADDLSHTVLIHNFETFDLVSNVPKEQLDLRAARVEFAKNEFDTIYKDVFFSPKNFTDIIDKFEPEFRKYVSQCITKKYPDLNNDKLDSTILALQTNFLAYMMEKQQKVQDIENEENDQTDPCYLLDYANRLTKLFETLLLDDPSSIYEFSDGLSEIEQKMSLDKRRHAGFDLLMHGISDAVQLLTGVFVEDPTKEPINLVLAFKNIPNNKDRDSLKKKISDIIEKVAEYYRCISSNLDKAKETAKELNPDKSKAYLLIMRNLVNEFINNTNHLITDYNNLRGHIRVDDILEQRKSEYRSYMEIFCSAMDTFMATIDSENLPDDEYRKNAISVWNLFNDARASEDNVWYHSLMQKYVTSFDELFGCLNEKKS